jgi:membrane fusion protein (multidrug efflux system)
VADQDSNKTQTAEIHGTVQIQQGGGAAQGPGGSTGQKPAPEPEETPERKSRRNAIVIVVVIVIAVLAGLYIWKSSYTEDTDDAQVDGDLYQVSSRVVGQVAHVDVEENQTVHVGDPIAEIDPKDLQVALAQAEADLANAQAEYEQAKVNVPITSVTVRTTLSTSGADVLGTQASVSQAQANVAAAQARVEQAKANALKAQLDVDRYTPLVEKDVISKQQFDAAVATAAGTKAALDEAQRSVAASQDQVRLAQQRLAQSRDQQRQNAQNGPEQVKVEQARAQAGFAAVQQAQAKVDQAKLNLSYTKITAPVAGIISKKNVSVGENLSIGQDLLTIVPLDNLWVTANFKETQLKKFIGREDNNKPLEVDIKVDALGGRKFKGHVTQIGGATGSRLSLFPPENATGNYVKVVQRIPVRIDFDNLAQDNADHALRPGMSVTPDVTVKQ